MITGIGTVFAAILAAVAAGIFWMQLGTMQAQLREQETDFRIDQRPIISDDDDPKLPSGVPLGQEYNALSGEYIWNYAIKNVGKTTAINMSMCGYISILGSHFKKRNCGKDNDLAPTRGTWATARYPDRITIIDINRAALSMGGIIVKVIVTYEDAYGTPYSSFMCSATNPNHIVGSCSHSQVDSIPTDDSDSEKKREQPH